MAREERFFRYEGPTFDDMRELFKERRARALEQFADLRTLLDERLPDGISVMPTPVTGTSQKKCEHGLYGVGLLDERTGCPLHDDRRVGDWTCEGRIGFGPDEHRYWRPKWSTKGIKPVRTRWEQIKFPNLGGMVLAEFGLGNELIVVKESGQIFVEHSTVCSRGGVLLFRVPVPADEEPGTARTIDPRLVEMKHSEFIAATKEAGA